MNNKLNWPLMKNNISKEDINILIKYLQQKDPRLTNGPKVFEFEKKWSEWLGTKYSTFVNSGSSANLITISILKELYGNGEIIVPALTWPSDIYSVIQNGFAPIFVDIDKKTLGMNLSQAIKKINNNTKAVFVTHILGYNALNEHFLNIINSKNIPLIEDVCESTGATFKNKKLGTLGLISNFSFFYAHHATSIEGGAICTNNKDIYEMSRIFRSHGMIRESKSENIKEWYSKKYPDLSTDFIFAYPAYNMRSTELNAILAINQLSRLDNNIKIRNKNLSIFLKNLDKEKYFTEFNTEGCSNYALTLIIKNKDDILYEKVIKTLKENQIEYRRGLSGGGNQLRQPYIKNILGEFDLSIFPNVEHIHKYGFYIGNYPDINKNNILVLCDILNNL